MLWSMYWLNYLDRNAIALARLDSLEEDLGLSDTQYQTCVSILFVGLVSLEYLESVQSSRLSNQSTFTAIFSVRSPPTCL